MNEPDQCRVRVHSVWSVVKGVSASKSEKWTLRFRCIDPTEENQNTYKEPGGELPSLFGVISQRVRTSGC